MERMRNSSGTVAITIVIIDVAAILRVIGDGTTAGGTGTIGAIASGRISLN